MNENVSDNDLQKKIFSAIESNDPVLLRTALADKPNVNVVDENLMTPLQHAAYKGNKDLLQMLLDYGADPNLCKHQHNYTALHFAGLSGNSDVCLALLVAGAKPDATNAVNRTAAQMAAFVGHHKCVAIINNYIPKSEIDHYTVVQGVQSEPYLPPYLSESVHKLVIQVNVHPVRVALSVGNFIGIAEHLPKVKKVLDLMSEKEMKRGSNNNEVLAFKFFYLAFIIGEITKIQKKQNLTDDEKKVTTLQVFSKNILKPGKDDSLEILDCLLRECIKEFPFRECTLLRQMVSALTGKDPPTALSVVSSAINGQRGFVDNIPVCYTCGEEKPSKKCSQCKVAQYCDKNCQKLHWHWHKKVCAKLAENPPKKCAEENEKGTVDSGELSQEISNLLISN